MRHSDTVAIARKDYSPPAYLIPTTELHFRLNPNATEVISRLSIVRAQGIDTLQPLVLDGVELTLKRVSIDGKELSEDAYEKTPTTLTLTDVPEQFELEIVTHIAPDANTALEGLYRSSGNYCTQCEAEGFRKITYFLDRPDVLSVFTVSVVGDKNTLPVLLSNGDPVSGQELADGLHQRVWHDPHPKPCYLFALVAGDLVIVEDSFTTQSGRKVLLQIYVQAHNKTLCDYAMQALKRSMRWDEEVYGLEYDLDRFMIVAVDDFNMGAMENKGLNIFNSKFVLASTKTATDTDFIGVEAVIAHEYFHNWTGNRVTCRDWFQLSLKEGLTVFRDQCFTADLHSPTVKRIQDVQLLRNHQFAEDASPMAHPIRPDSYVEINNFYTLTVYEKGAEVIRMFHTLLGDAAYRAGIDLYFERHDGKAVTCDDFIDAMQDASGMDLTQFRRWYSQAGTPTLQVQDNYDKDKQTYSLTIEQSTPDTPGQQNKEPLHVPVDIALLNEAGKPMPIKLQDPTHPTAGGGVLLHLTKKSQQWNFENISSKPVLSLLRQFSAPVKAHYPYDARELAFLMANDTDTFNRWEAAQRLGAWVIAELEQGDSAALPVYLMSLQQVLSDSSIDDALKAQMITPPSFDAIAQAREVVDVRAILDARRAMREAVAEHCQSDLLQLILQRPVCSATDPNPLSDDSMAKRSLANAALQAVSVLPPDSWLSLAEKRYNDSYTMSDRMGALSVVCEEPGKTRDNCLQHFHDEFAQHKLVIDKWFMLQALADYDNALADLQALTTHTSFDASNPNRLRSVYSAFATSNPSQFHTADGSGYRWIADGVLEIDARNPQVAARLVTPLTRWERFSETSAALMKDQLQRIAQSDRISPDVFELVSKGLSQNADPLL